MIFKKHLDLVGQHAFLSASKYHWVNYTEDGIVNAFTKFKAVKRGIELHEFAKKCIELGIKLPVNKKALNSYVNDAIGYRMTPEQVLFYSENAFGTADAISFRDDMLRIHDLKTGVTPVSIKQLEVYSALFCLEYSVDPKTISIELRIYQADSILVSSPSPDEILWIMEKIILFDKKIEALKAED